MDTNERIARVEAVQQAHETRMNAFESRVDTRLSKIEEKLDKLWWKFGLLVGAFVGTGQVVAELIK